MKKPELSIVMPAYNASLFINETIQSLLNQTYKDFELIISDDRSTDHTVDLIREFTDPRIILLQNETNAGPAENRNRGIKIARGKYIAAFDADDIAQPRKFEKQVQFLEKHREFGMIGCWAQLINAEGSILKTKWKLNASPDRIPAKMLFRNYFVHAAMVYRKEAMPSHLYTQGFELVEDYKLHLDILSEWKAWNLPAYLVQYRIHGTSGFHQDQMRSAEAEKLIFEWLMKKLDIEPSEDLFQRWYAIKAQDHFFDANELQNIAALLDKILGANYHKKIYHSHFLAREAANRWLKCVHLARNNLNLNDLIRLAEPSWRYLISALKR